MLLRFRLSFRLMLLFHEYGTNRNLELQLVDREMWMVDAKVLLNYITLRFPYKSSQKILFFCHLSPTAVTVCLESGIPLEQMKAAFLHCSPYFFSSKCISRVDFSPFVIYFPLFLFFLSKPQLARPETCCLRCWLLTLLKEYRWTRPYSTPTSTCGTIQLRWRRWVNLQ